jgi:uncharacterized membrane protein YeaQ/YmgE (transglycosylase-associated protein family)
LIHTRFSPFPHILICLAALPVTFLVIMSLQALIYLILIGAIAGALHHVLAREKSRRLGLVGTIVAGVAGSLIAGILYANLDQRVLQVLFGAAGALTFVYLLRLLKL